MRGRSQGSGVRSQRAENRSQKSEVRSKKSGTRQRLTEFPTDSCPLTPDSFHAFTLLEILVVLVIIGVLAALAVPLYQRSVEGGRAAACVSNLRQLGVGLNLYLAENNMTMPTLKTARASLEEDLPVIDNTLDKYLKDKGVFACPSDPKWAKLSGTSYSWNNALNGQSAASLNFLGIVQDHTHIPVLGDKEGFHPYTDNKVNILYADGHATKEVKFFTEK